MTVLPLLAVGILMKFVAFLFALVCVVLVLVVLVQKGRGGGLSGAFGGGMASGLLGSKTGDFLTWVTIGLFVVFLGLAVLLARYYRPDVSKSYSDQPQAPTSQSAPATPEQKPAAAPAQQPTPTAPATQTPAAPEAGTQQPAPNAPTGGSGGQ